MATMRGSARLFQTLRPACSQGQRRLLSTGTGAGAKSWRPLVLGAMTAGAGAFGVYKYTWESKRNVIEDLQSLAPKPVHAVNLPEAQPSVWSGGKNNALYLWIHLKPNANVKDVAKVACKLQKFVDQVVDPKTKDEDDEVLAGVGFGPNFYKQIGGNVKQDYNFAHRKGALGDMPSSGGDVFFHAKCNTQSKLFELAQLLMKNMPAGSVDKAEDIYSFVFKNGRDLSGFIDGTENPADDESRQNVAVEPGTGGSYVITQKWIHDFSVINNEKDKTMEGWVGRTRPDSMELSRKSITSHVARMTGGNAYQQKKKFEMVRQSMPFGTVTGEAGLFFIGYCASPDNLNFMIDRMVGAGGDGQSDDIMKLTRNVKGTYWYFPGTSELTKLA
ncbi:dye-decolorizing peroxidase YfeX-like [Ylistrum balloti]|uniref:dye-decolorizing peroxidase YfeX-like n=1 Tax=Ylistrum balloti TaxID=509963 RepID=UPI002905F769|nr:dye-decolorizing peroxidase YfeX-like [Ylistrum balloti]